MSKASVNGISVAVEGFAEVLTRSRSRLEVLSGLAKELEAEYPFVQIDLAIDQDELKAWVEAQATQFFKIKK